MTSWEEGDVRLRESGPQCITYKPAGLMSQTPWQRWPVCVCLTAFLPNTSSLVSFHYCLFQFKKKKQNLFWSLFCGVLFLKAHLTACWNNFVEIILTLKAKDDHREWNNIRFELEGCLPQLKDIHTGFTGSSAVVQFPVLVKLLFLLLNWSH